MSDSRSSSGHSSAGDKPLVIGQASPLSAIEWLQR
jgi:hypothetical protein